MEITEEKYAGLIQAFHLTWGNYPWAARLIDKKNCVIAVNKAARAEGYAPGQICARIGRPRLHKGCKRALTISTQKAQYDRPFPDRMRVWLPVDGYPDVVVHFTVVIPEMGV